MLDRIITFSVRNKFIVILLTLAMIAWGVFSMLNISIDAVPDITNNQVQIVTVSPSLAAKEVEQFITYPIEMEMANVQDVEEIRSISRYGLSVVTVVFKENVPVLDARQLVGQQLQVAVQEIPEGYGEPGLMPITTGLGEIFQYTLDVKEGYENKYTPTKLRTIHDWIVKRQLNGIPGIVEISSFGGFVKQYEVAVNPQLLNNYDLTLLDVNRALKGNNQNTGGSYIQKGPYAYYIRTNGLIADEEDIKQIVIKTIENIPITINDIAEVRIGHPARFGAMTKDGKGEAVGGITLMLKGGNASQVIKEVKTRIEQIEKNLPEGVELNPYLDRAVLVQKVINTVATNLVEGGLIVIFILVLLLGNFRAGLIVASIIPLSMLFAFAMMRTFGISATVMSLGAIDFGLIVDATVIIIESIIYQIEKNKTKLTGGQMDELVLSSTLKIRNSAAFGAIIILIVYFPILALTGIEGKMFKPMALTVGFAIIGALILSFTYIPMMSALFLSKEIKKRKTLADRIMDLLYRTYEPIFNWALRFKRAVLLVAFGLLMASLLIFNIMGAEFLPDLDEGDIAMQMTIPPGSSLNESVKTSTKAEKILLDNFPEVKAVVSKIGTAEVPTDPMAIEDADIMIILKDRKEWVSADNREELADMMKEKLDVIAGASFEFTQPIQLRFNELLTGAKSDVVVKIYGEDLSILFDKANEVAGIISGIPGAADIKVEQIEGLPQLVVNYKREEIAKYGLTIEDINTMIRTATAGEKVGVIFEGERKFDLVVRMQKAYRTNFNNFDNFYIKAPNGHPVPLNDVASMDFIESPTQVSRDNTQRRISVGINVRNRDVQSLVEEIQSNLEETLDLPIGYYIQYGGKFENLQSAMKRLKVVVPIALILILILLYFAFGTFKQAALIFLTIPLSIIGGIFALWTRGLPFSISAGIGFIALFGVAVLDGIVLINHLNELKKKGINDLHERLKIGTKNRLRPVTITSAVASLGFLPMALSSSSGAEVQRPLATVVIGGIITSTFLTMIVLPMVYYYFEKGIKIKINPKKATLLLLIVSFPFFGKSQVQNDTIFVNVDNAVQTAYENNSEIKNAKLSVDKFSALKKSTFDLGNSEFELQRGEINSSYIDHNLTIRQNFGNILSNIYLNKYYKTLGDKQNILVELKKKEVELNVKNSFYSWQILDQKQKAIDSLLIKLKAIVKIAELRYETGESDHLSKLNTLTRLNQLELKQQSVIAEKVIALYGFNFLLQVDSVFVPVPLAEEKIILRFVDDSTSTNTYFTDLYKTDVEIKEAELKKEQAEFFPELFAGYFNQQIDNIRGFQGWEIGLSLPIFAFSKIHKNKAKKIELEITENEADQSLKKLELERQKLYRKYELLSKEVSGYEYTILINSEIALKNADVLIKAGEISYYEYLQTFERYTKVKFDYYDVISELNKTVLLLQYLTL